MNCGVILTLSQLHIENVAVIEQADLELGTGFNVLSGETGAGKSMLIDSINLVLGERVSKDVVRNGASSAQVSALFSGVAGQAAEKLSEMGFECEEDGNLLVSRELSADGRSSCRISGRPATVSILRDIGRLLVNIHGQHDNQVLLSAEKHVYYLDRYAGLENQLTEYAGYYHEMKRIRGEIDRIETDEAQKARRIDLLNYQINEISSALLKPGEEENLLAQKSMILNYEKITSAVSSAYASLNGCEDGSEGALDFISSARDELAGISDFYPDIKELAERIAGLSYELDDCITELRTYTGETEYNPNDIDQIEQRLDTLYRLKLKYGGTVEKTLEYLKQCENELESLEMSEVTIKRLSSELEKAIIKAKEVAKKLSEKRTLAASEMEQKIKAELVFLEMPGVQFKVEIVPSPELTADGQERVEFLISANPGSPLKPLAKIASGGEISRIMLAIKTVLAGNDDIDTLIFDEIDTGVSGRAAQKIGMKMRQVARQRQVVCVTHLAQIAAQAQRHILIEKSAEKGNTFTRLHVLDFEGRKRELARIIGGVEITQLTLQNAGEMLKIAGVDNT